MSSAPPQPLRHPEPAPEHEYHVHAPPPAEQKHTLAVEACLSECSFNWMFELRGAEPPLQLISGGVSGRGCETGNQTSSNAATNADPGIRGDPARLGLLMLGPRDHPDGRVGPADSDQTLILQNSCLVCFGCVYFCFSDLIYFFLFVFLLIVSFPCFPCFFPWLLTEDLRPSLLLQLLSSFSRQPCWFLGSFNSRFQTASLLISIVLSCCVCDDPLSRPL